MSSENKNSEIRCNDCKDDILQLLADVTRTKPLKKF